LGEKLGEGDRHSHLLDLALGATADATKVTGASGVVIPLAATPSANLSPQGGEEYERC
jgi:hypothetical protein